MKTELYVYDYISLCFLCIFRVLRPFALGIFSFFLKRFVISSLCISRLVSSPLLSSLPHPSPPPINSNLLFLPAFPNVSLPNTRLHPPHRLAMPLLHPRTPMPPHLIRLPFLPPFLPLLLEKTLLAAALLGQEL